MIGIMYSLYPTYGQGTPLFLWKKWVVVEVLGMSLGWKLQLLGLSWKVMWLR
jgi:hypothetical protein